MKVEIRASGRLMIDSENELEAYALFKWMEENVSGDPDDSGTTVIPSKAIMFRAAFPVKPLAPQ